MLARFIERVYRANLGRGAVQSLEYAMVMMLVAVAALGAFTMPTAHGAQAAAQASRTIQLASTN